MESVILQKIQNLQKYESGVDVYKQVGAQVRAEKAERFRKMLRTFYMKNSQKVSKHPDGAFSARKTLQKFGYSLLEHVGALF